MVYVAKPNKDLFEELKKEILSIDPVAFCENHLTVDGRPLKLDGTGWQFLADIYRHLAISAIRPDAKPTIIVKGRQVGATTMAVALEMYFCTSGLYGTSPDNPPVRILHCFPNLPNVNKFAKEKLGTMMRTSKDDWVKKHGLKIDPKTGKVRGDVPDDTLLEKLFQYENKLWVDSNGNNASRLQGMTIDIMLLDEVQRSLEDDIANALRTLTQAKHGPVGKGVQLYFGTPLTKGSYFWKLWNASDQRHYHLGCVKCGYYFLLYTPNSDEWENIWLYGNIVQCPKCRHEQEKVEAVLNGKWIATQKTLDGDYEPQYTGFHISQLLIPTFTKEVIQSENPKYNPTKSERIWITDILGEFYSGAALPITEEEIYEKCANRDKCVSSAIAPDKTLDVFLGIDWGGKTDEGVGGQSYSTVVIASVRKGDDILQIENAFKMRKTDTDYKKAVVSEMYRRFGVNLTVADIGFGNDIVPDLQKEYQNRLLGCMNNGSLAKPLKFIQDSLTVICNKDLLLDDVFNMMRRGKIKFPLGDSSFDKMTWLIEHCASMERTTKTVAGNVVNRYEKGNTPNDGLMSILYTVVAWKLYRTNFLKIKEHRVGKSANKPVLAHIPRL